MNKCVIYVLSCSGDSQVLYALSLSTKLVHVIHDDPPAPATDSSPSPLKWPHRHTPSPHTSSQWWDDSGDVEQ